MVQLDAAEGPFGENTFALDRKQRGQVQKGPRKQLAVEKKKNMQMKVRVRKLATLAKLLQHPVLVLTERVALECNEDPTFKASK